MARRKTTPLRSSSRSQVLELRVVTPRIVWYAARKMLGKMLKWGFLLALLGGTGFGIWRYLQSSYLDNPNYQLRIVKLNPNTAMNEADVVEFGQISLNTSIFGIAVGDVERRLSARPEVISVTVRRELPATISVDLRERIPFAWVDCAAKGMLARSRTEGFLIDREGHLYPCPPMQFDAALVLPVIEVAAEDADSLKLGEVVETNAMRRSIHLLEISHQLSGDRLPWIDRVQPYTVWAMKVWTRDGIEAVFGLEEHERQMGNLMIAMKHATAKGVQIATINLIPEHNIPVTLRAPGSTFPVRVSPRISPHTINTP